MNKLNILKIFCLAFVALSGLQSCSEEEVPTYSYDKCLYFHRYMQNEEGERVRVDTVDMSFSHHYGITEFTQEFYLGLIGDTLSSDMEYKLEVVEKETTAKPDQYSLPEKLIFHKGTEKDILNITVYKDKMAKDEQAVLVLRLVENENFKVGYSAVGDSYTKIKFRFNNKISRPLWWKGDISNVFFGEYSYKKFETIILANPGFTTVEGMGSAEIRKIALNAKKYIEENGITEEDGSPMEFPIY